MFAKLSMLELRSTQQVCGSQCSTFGCYKGSPDETSFTVIDERYLSPTPLHPYTPLSSQWLRGIRLITL
jgi:hypothetical protein